MGGTSWLTAVKRAFRSPTKDSVSHHKNSRRKVDHQTHEPPKRKWIFRKKETSIPKNSNAQMEQLHAIAVAEAAFAAAKAAVEIIRLSHPSDSAPSSFKLHSSAKVIQTAFRGYLARKALLALKGIVKFQALIRGQNVRREAAKTMKCMQSLLRVQSLVRRQRARLSHDAARRSMFEQTANFQDPISRNGSFVSQDWSINFNFPRTLDELEAVLKYRNRSAAKTVENDDYSCRSRCPSPVHIQRTPRFTSWSMANTPSLRSTPRISSCISRYTTTSEDEMFRPNYMAPTESAKAKTRSQSVPRQRNSTPERERGSSARRRLTYYVPEPEQRYGSKLKSPSLKSMGEVEEQSVYSCYAKSAGEVLNSPFSTREFKGLCNVKL